MNKPLSRKNDSDPIPLGIFTCDRSGQFRDCLESVISFMDKQSGSGSLLVLDDSREVRNEESNRDSVSFFRGMNNHVSLSIAGRTEKVQYLERLWERYKPGLQRLPQDFLHPFVSISPLIPELSSFEGGNRTMGLLFFAGKRHLTIDDDTLFHFVMRKTGRFEVLSANVKDALNITPFSEMKFIKKHTDPFDGNPVDMFNTAFDLGTESGGNGEREKKVLAVMAGIYGGRWYARPFGFYFTDGALRKETMRNRKVSTRAKTDPRSLLIGEQIILTGDPFFVTTAVAYDGTVMLPPFLPHIRGSDSVWVRMLKVFHPDALIAHLPFAVYHDPENKRPFTEEDFSDVVPDMGHLSYLIIDAVAEKFPHMKAQDASVAMGKRLMETGRLAHREWTDLCHCVWLRHAGATIARLEELLEKYRRKPSFWAADADRFIGQLRDVSFDPELIIPKELRQFGTPEESGRKHRELLFRYGELLTHWPDIWDTAVRLNEEGRGPADMGPERGE